MASPEQFAGVSAVAPNLFGSDAEASVQYVVPYHWGEFIVSRAAHETYGLVAFTANTQPFSDYQPDESLRPRVSIALVSGQELGRSNVPFLEGKISTEGKPATVDNTIALGIAIVGDRKSLHDHMIESEMRRASRVLGVGLEEARDIIQSQLDVPIDELTEQKVQQHMAEALAGNIAQGIAPQIVAWHIEQDEKKTLRSVLESLALNPVLRDSQRRQVGAFAAGALIGGSIANDVCTTFSTVDFNEVQSQNFRVTGDE